MVSARWEWVSQAATLLGLWCVVLGGGCGSGSKTEEADSRVTDQSAQDERADEDISAPGDQTDKPDSVPLDVPEQDLGPVECDYDWECDDSQACTNDFCGDTGVCEHTSTQAACDDNDLCTSNDTCTNGKCVGTPKACNDGNECTVDACKKGECTFKASSDSACALDITFDTPVLGAHLIGPGPVLVTGHVTSPAAAVSSLKVGIFDVTPDAEGNFVASVLPRVGVNIVEATVQDALERSAKAQRSFVVAGRYNSPGSSDSPTLLTLGDGAAEAFARYDVFDDDDVDDVDDLASIAWLIMTTLDLNSLIPHPLVAEGEGVGVAWCEWTVDVSEIEYAMNDVDIVPIDGGMYLTTSLTNFSAYVSAVADWCPDALGYVYADELWVEATIYGSATGNCKVELSLASSNVVISGLSVDMTGGFASLFDWLINWFSEELSAMIEEKVETWFAQAFVEKVGSMLGDLTDYQTEFSVPALPGNPPGNPMALRVCASELDFTSWGGTAGVHAGVATDKAIDHTAPGSVARQSCSVAPGGIQAAAPLAQSDQIEVAIAEDVVNQVLFSLWWGGHLNVALSSDTFDVELSGFGIDGGNVDTNPYLPPILTTCTEDGSAEVQIGDLQLLVDLTGDTLSGSMEIMASVRVAAEPLLTFDPATGRNSIGIKILGVKQLSAQVLSSEGNLVGSEGLVESLISAVVVDLFAGQALSDALGAYPIPVVDLGAYVSMIPAGSNITFNPQTAEFSEGYLLLGGELVSP